MSQQNDPRPTEVLKSVARHPFAWPGGYARRLVLDDGATLCRECVKTEYRSLYRSTRDGDKDGWSVAGEYIFWEGVAEQCVHCGATIESEYGDPEVR